MKKLLYYFALSFVIFGCSKTTVEPDPSDQVLGTYNATTYTATSNGSGYVLDLTNSSSTLQISFQVIKKAATTATIIEKDVEKDATGKIINNTYTYDVDIKKNATVSTQYDMTDSATGVARGSFNGTTMNFLNEFDYKDTTSGNTIHVKETITAKKV